jgi:hypothetical protein
LLSTASRPLALPCVFGANARPFRLKVPTHFGAKVLGSGSPVVHTGHLELKVSA